MKTIAIIQARMQSSRLPGKVLLELNGKPVLGNIFDRVSKCKNINNIVIATSIEKSDDEIEAFCKKENIDCFRGSQNNVLERFYLCSFKYGADVIVRLTGDNALVDPDILNEGLGYFYDVFPDYLFYKRRLPLGMAVEIFRKEALEKAYYETDDIECKEHVTPYMRRNPQAFQTINYEDTTDMDYSDIRFTIDSELDFEFVGNLYRCFNNNTFSLGETLQVLEDHPEWRAINAGVVQKRVTYHAGTYLREAVLKDCKMLLEWANDPVVRKNSFSVNQITREDHEIWFDNILKDPNEKLLIFMDEDVPIGQVRLECRDGRGLIHYSIVSRYRGKGFGNEIIKEIIDYAKKNCDEISVLLARVKEENLRSKKVFLANGFSKEEDIYKLTLTKQ